MRSGCRIAPVYCNSENRETERVIRPVLIGYLDGARMPIGWRDLRKISAASGSTAWHALRSSTSVSRDGLLRFGQDGSLLADATQFGRCELQSLTPGVRRVEPAHLRAAAVDR
jgi:hypothetical protein